MGLGELIPLLKPIAEVGVLVLMSVIVAAGFVWLIRFELPRRDRAEREQREAVEGRHRAESDATEIRHRAERDAAEAQWKAERTEQRNDFLAALQRQRESYAEFMEAQQHRFLASLDTLDQRVTSRHEANLASLNALEQRWGDRHAEMTRRVMDLEEGLDTVCQYRPRRQSWAQPQQPQQQQQPQPPEDK